MGLKEKMQERARRREAQAEEMRQAMEASQQPVERNEKGMIKRDGFRVNQGMIHYGQDFEEENFDAVFKKTIVFVIFFALFAGCALILVLKYLIL